jgi:HEAT repeat protein
MRKACTLAALASALSLFVTSSLAAHGGSYVGPTDTVPPNVGPPPSNTPPGGGPTPTPAPPGGKTGGKSPPTTGGQNAPNGGPGGGARATTGVPRRRGASGQDRWEIWWELNDDAYLGLKRRLLQARETTEAAGYLIGRASADRASRPTRTTEAERARIESALLAVLESDEADVVDSAVLALARGVPAERGAEVVAVITKTLGHRAKSARESAALALGVLGAPAALPVLRDLLLDRPEGRRVTGQGAHVEDLVRAFAAASIGMIGQPEDIDHLERAVLDESLGANLDAKALAVLALGLIKGGHEQAAPFLLQLLDDRTLAPAVRAQAPIALARLAEQPAGAAAARAALSSLVGRLGDDRTDFELRRSLAVALGRISAMDDEESLSALAEAAERSPDDSTRHFALIALGEIGARDEHPDRRARGHEALSRILLDQLVRPRRVTQRPFAALALAIHARNDRLDRALRDEAARKLREQFLDANDPSFKGACAIALGLLCAREAKDDLAEAFAESRDDSFRGYAAVASGLLLDRSRADTLRELLGKQGLDARTNLQFARALGLLGDPSAVPPLVKSLEQADTVIEVASSAQALGLLGDHRAVEPLIRVLEDRTQAPQRRGFAAVALGLLVEKTEMPWNVTFAAATNYRARTAALLEIQDIL